MRDILFRGKREDNGEWVIGGTIVHFLDDGIHSLYIPQFKDTCETRYDEETGNLHSIENCVFYKVRPETVGQYTGWQDKHGTMIFEDDIVVTPADCKSDGNFKGFIGKVMFQDGRWQVYWWNYFADNFRDLYLFTKRSEIEVVGNIYDNEELLWGCE